MTPYKKLLEYRKIPKKIALFPIMILDEMVNILDVFFPKKDGYYVLTKDQSSFSAYYFEMSHLIPNLKCHIAVDLRGIPCRVYRV